MSNKDLIAEAKGKAAQERRISQSAGTVNGKYAHGDHADLYEALADALEAAEQNRDEFRAAWNTQGFEIIALERQLAAAQAVIAEAAERLEHVMHPDTTRCYLCAAENALAQSPTGALEAVKAKAWEEGDLARLMAMEQWLEPDSTERMYWPDTVNPYRKTEGDKR